LSRDHQTVNTKSGEFERSWPTARILPRHFRRPVPFGLDHFGVELVTDVKPKEFEDVFTEHYQLLYHTAYAVTGHRHDAEDVLQSVFIRLRQDGLSPALKRTSANGLHREVMNFSLIVLRARKRQTGDDSREGDVHEQLMTAIARLKPRAFVILLLHYKHDYSDAQIAALLGSSPGTIAVTLSRVRARLRKRLRAIGCDEAATRDSLRELIDRHIALPSHGELSKSRDRILDRLLSTAAPQMRSTRRKDGAPVSWWGTILEALTR
jgi:RNA polymerase sigma-70 factor, ECF subfamily